MSDKMILYFLFLYFVLQHQFIYKFVSHGDFNNIDRSFVVFCFLYLSCGSCLCLWSFQCQAHSLSLIIPGLQSSKIRIASPLLRPSVVISDLFFPALCHRCKDMSKRVKKKSLWRPAWLGNSVIPWSSFAMLVSRSGSLHFLNVTSLYVSLTWRTELGLGVLIGSRKKDGLFQRMIHLKPLSWRPAGPGHTLGTVEFWVVHPGVLGKCKHCS